MENIIHVCHMRRVATFRFRGGGRLDVGVSSKRNATLDLVSDKELVDVDVSTVWF